MEDETKKPVDDTQVDDVHADDAQADGYYGEDDTDEEVNLDFLDEEDTAEGTVDASEKK